LNSIQYPEDLHRHNGTTARLRSCARERGSSTDKKHEDAGGRRCVACDVRRHGRCIYIFVVRQEEECPTADVSGTSNEARESRVLSAEEILHSLEKGIPGATDVRAYPTPGAKQLIVHIRKVHGMEWMIHDRIEAAIVSLPDTHKLVVERFLAGEDISTMDYPWLGANERQSFARLFSGAVFQRLRAMHADFSDSPDSTKNKSIRRICTELVQRMTRERSAARAYP
jgi:hypothetical protein